MLIYNKDNITVDLNLEIVPSIVTISINNVDYLYNILGETTEPCPYDKQIKQWFEDNKHVFREIVWEWNTNKPEYSKIEVPLVL